MPKIMIEIAFNVVEIACIKCQICINKQVDTSSSVLSYCARKTTKLNETVFMQIINNYWMRLSGI